ncbi:MAG: vWA domain-containing protein [Bryobacteraceae bacterium]
MVTAIMMVLALPMMGLMFDSTILFIIKSRLQGAVDGAALAGARGLARGSNSSQQITSAQAAATSYVRLNYPNNSFFSGAVTIPSPTVDLSVAFQRTVTVTANVPFPGLILQYMAGPTTVRASAAVTRKDVNVAMVLDRSGSLSASGSCAPMKAAAASFVDQFAPGRDNIGLVTFAFTSYVNFPIANTFQTANPNVKTLVNNITCAGSTSTAMGLWLGYQQLVGLNQPGALNVILLFTDGEPTAAAFNMPVANGSPCTAYTAGNPTGPGGYTRPATAKGYMRGLMNTYSNSAQFFGINDYVGTTVAGQQSITNGDNNKPPNSNNCAYVSNANTLTDWAGVPLVDLFGNSTNSGYQPVTLTNGMISLGNASNAPAMAINAADSAATRIRNGVIEPINGGSLANVLILSIGLGTSAVGPASPTFLRRVSNDPLSTIYDPTKPTGHYYDAPTIADLAPAFQEVASEILRLAR